MPYNHIGHGFSADITRTFRNMLNQSQLKSTWRQNDRTVLLQMAENGGLFTVRRRTKSARISTFSPENKSLPRILEKENHAGSRPDS